MSGIVGPYGPLVGGDDVCAAGLEVLQLWLPGALAEVSRLRGVELEPVRSWDVVTDADQATSDQLPAVFVLSDGTVAVERHARGKHDAVWNLHAHVVIRGETYTDTTFRVGWYTKAIRAVLLQRRSLDGFCEETSWVGEDYAAGKTKGPVGRTLAEGAVEILVFVKDAVDASAGPSTPITGPEPPGPWPTVDQIGVDVDNVPVSEELTA